VIRLRLRTMTRSRSAELPCHWLDSVSMVLLDNIIEVFDLPQTCEARQLARLLHRFACARIGGILVDCDRSWPHSMRLFQGLAKEAPRSSRIALAAQKEIDRLPSAVNGTIKICPPTFPSVPMMMRQTPAGSLPLGHRTNIQWLCPKSKTARLLQQPALIRRTAGGQRSFQRRLLRRLNFWTVPVAAHSRRKTSCASLRRSIARWAS